MTQQESPPTLIIQGIREWTSMFQSVKHTVKTQTMLMLMTFTLVSIKKEKKGNSVKGRIHKNTNLAVNARL